MKKIRKFQNIDNLIEASLAEAFGFDDEGLAAEFDRAANEPDDPELSRPPGEFEKIMVQVTETKNKTFRFKGIVRAGILVALLGSVLLGTGIGASGKRGLEYTIRKSGNGSVWNNTDNLYASYELTEIYQQIEDELGISVLKLYYMPSGMAFMDCVIDKGYARLRFLYKDNIINYTQYQYNVENSGSTVSDRKEKYYVYNKRLGLRLPIYENTLPGDKIELSSDFVIDKAYFSIDGIIDEEEFKKILVKISL